MRGRKRDEAREEEICNVKKRREREGKKKSQINI